MRKSLLFALALLTFAATALAQDTYTRFRGLIRIDYPDAPTIYGIAEIRRDEVPMLGMLYLGDWDIEIALEYPGSLRDIDCLLDGVSEIDSQHADGLRSFIADEKIYITAPRFRLMFIAFEQATRQWIADRNGIQLVSYPRYRITTRCSSDGVGTIGIHRIQTFTPKPLRIAKR